VIGEAAALGLRRPIVSPPHAAMIRSSESGPRTHQLRGTQDLPAIAGTAVPDRGVEWHGNQVFVFEGEISSAAHPDKS